MALKQLICAVVCLSLFSRATLAAEAAKTGKPKGVQIIQQDGKLRIEMDGELFANYYYSNVSRPYLYPIVGAEGRQMTRHWPQEQAENEEHDHPHHKSWWYAHGKVNGIDFWSEEKGAGKTAHEKFTKIKSGAKKGEIHSSNKLVAPDGKVVATDDRRIVIHAGPGGTKIMDFEINIHASQGDLTFGDTKEGTMALRLAETMRVKGKVGKGHIVNSEGVKDGATWGKRAKWCDYYGPVDGQTVGVAVFDSPTNPRHPTWWHVRDYGLFAANPFGLHDFEGQKPGAGDLVVPKGKSIRFNYRFYFHPGDTEQGKVAEAWAQYSKVK